MSEADTDQIHVLDAVGSRADDDRLDDLRERMATAIDHFDALGETTVTVARLKPDKEYVRNPVAAADSYNRLVYVPVDERLTDVTLFHELAHLDIRLCDERHADLPTTSEKFCSIYAVARMPPERVDRGRIAYLGRPTEPRDEWPRICRRGLDYREDNHDYIQQTKEWLGIGGHGR